MKLGKNGDVGGLHGGVHGGRQDGCHGGHGRVELGHGEDLGSDDEIEQ